MTTTVTTQLNIPFCTHSPTPRVVSTDVDEATPVRHKEEIDTVSIKQQPPDKDNPKTYVPQKTQASNPSSLVSPQNKYLCVTIGTLY